MSTLHTPHVSPSLLHSSAPLDYRFITVVGLLVQGSLVYTSLYMRCSRNFLHRSCCRRLADLLGGVHIGWCFAPERESKGICDHDYQASSLM
jgi:hypothetical protein